MFNYSYLWYGVLNIHVVDSCFLNLILCKLDVSPQSLGI